MEIGLLTLAVVLILGALLYRYATRNDFYFADKPIPFMRPSFLVGNLGPLMMKKRDIFEHFRILYNTFPDAKVFGLFSMTSPVFLIRDPEIAKRVVVKDFDHFVDHTGMGTEKELENSHMLFHNTLVGLRGEKWRDMRATLSPAFTGSKMRQMLELISECGVGLVEYYRGLGGSQVVEMKDVFSRFANDVIATVAFGIKVDSFREQDNEFFTLGKQVMKPSGLVTILKMMAFAMFPKLMLKLNIDILTEQQDKFFRGMVLDTMKIRAEKNIFRPDMIELLMQAKKGNLKHQGEDQQQDKEGFATVEESQIGRKNHNRVWSDSELIAQALIFFLAGFDTVSTTLSLAVYELTRNVDVQQKLFEEIQETKSKLDGKPLTYDILQGMKYMDMVVSEVLRMWPIGTLVDRLCVKDYVYDDGQGCRFKIEKGKSIMVSVIGMHYDPQYFPDPEKFDPERFSDENRHKINMGTYLPFGLGPRNCIGSRFALMEMKTIIFHLLADFSLNVHEKTQIPLQIAKSMAGFSTEKGVWVELRPRNLA